LNFTSKPVDLLLPTYNVQKYILQTLESIVSQSFQEFNLLILDDCSTDNTFEIINFFAKSDPRIKLFRNEENLGVVNSRNKLFELSKSELLAICDADDIYHPTRLEKQIDFLNNNEKIAAVSCNFNVGINGSKVTKIPTSPNMIQAYLYLKNVIPNPGAMLRCSSLLKNNLLYTKDFPYVADFHFWAKLSENEQLANISNCLFMYRVHSEQISSKRNLEQQENHIKLVKSRMESSIKDCSYTTLKALIWHHKIHKSSQLVSICRETDKVIRKLSQDYKDNPLVSLIFDISLKSFCKNYGIKGLKNYIKYRGLDNFLKGKFGGLAFAFDCIKKSNNLRV
jgi:glycosyltransferase involved in cell wall biosynthesis